MAHERKKVVHKRVKENGRTFRSLYLDMRNASLILLSEGEESIGTLAVGIPHGEKLGGHDYVDHVVSSVLFGNRNAMTARILAEYLAKKTKRIALVSIFTKSIDEEKAGHIFTRLMKKTVGNEGAENKVVRVHK